MNDCSEKYFTQYFPHEHLDMPPIEMNKGDYNGGLYERTQLSGLILYLDGYKQFMAEELTRLQRDWRKIRNAPPTDRRLKEMHIRLDKILHPLEDFFYHSNFVEGLLARELLRTNQNATAFDAPEVDAYVSTGMATDLPRYFRGINRNEAGTTVAAAPAWIRKALRRLRFPVYEGPGAPSRKESAPDAGCVYTGGFAGDDIFHTIIGALESMQQLLAPMMAVKQSAKDVKSLVVGAPSSTESAINGLVLFRALMDTSYRKALANADVLSIAQGLHRVQLAAGEYHKAIDGLVQAGYLNAAGRDALKQALELDKAFTAKWTKAKGIGEFVLAVLAEGQIAESASQDASTNLDRGGAPQPPLADDYLATDNGTTSELIGTHTLMSKDSGHSLPFHLEAQTLGRFAAYLVADIFLTAANGPTKVGPLAFDRLLNQLMRFPTLYGWETKVLKFQRKNGHDPEFEDVQVDPAKMTAAFQADNPTRLNDRIDQFHAKDDLEKKYRDLERNTT